MENDSNGNWGLLGLLGWIRVLLWGRCLFTQKYRYMIFKYIICVCVYLYVASIGQWLKKFTALLSPPWQDAIPKGPSSSSNFEPSKKPNKKNKKTTPFFKCYVRFRDLQALRMRFVTKAKIYILPVGGETGGRIGRNDQTPPPKQKAETVPRLDLSRKVKPKTIRVKLCSWKGWKMKTKAGHDWK